MVLLFLTGAFWVAVQPAMADPAPILETRLPAPRNDISAIWDGGRAYVFGGGPGYQNQIIRFDPATGAVTTMGATLPTGRYATSAVWDGTNAYIFGGDDGRRQDQILRYHPATDTLTVMGARLPTGRSHTSAVWDGANVYIFGGISTAGPLDQILRYNPGSDTITTLVSRLPSARFHTAAAWTGSDAYVFGGWDWNSYSTDIVRFNPTQGSVSILEAHLPFGLQAPSAAWDGRNAYIMGGFDGTQYHDEILRFDPFSAAVVASSTQLPSGRAGGAVVWANLAVLHFGGFDGSSSLDEIVRFDPDEGTLVGYGDPPGPLPAGWAQTPLFDETTPVEVPAVSQAPLLVIDGRPNPANDRLYDVTIVVNGQPSSTLTLNTGGNVPPIHKEANAPGQRAWVYTAAAYRHDPTQVTPLACAGACVNTPVDPFSAGWLAGPGQNATFVLHARVDVDASTPTGDRYGRTVADLFLVIPVVGQVIAGAAS